MVYPQRFASLSVALALFVGGGAPLAAEPKAEASKAHLRVHPENPRIFEFRGKPTVLVGSPEPHGAVLNLDFDYRVYLEELAAKGQNYARIFTGTYVQAPGPSGSEKNTLTPAPERFLAPWARSGKPGYINGGNKFDLDHWDLAYFDRLKDFVAHASRLGIVVEVTLFSAFRDDASWQASPLHERNNINKVGALDRKRANTLENGKLWGHQDALARQMVRALADADNVIIEIASAPWADFGGQNAGANKDIAASLAWQKKLVVAITRETRGHKIKPIIAQNIVNKSSAVKELNPDVSVVNFHHAYPPDPVMMNLYASRAVGLDQGTFTQADDASHRKHAWSFILAGGSLFTSIDRSFTTTRPNGTGAQPPSGGTGSAFRAQLGVLLRFVHGFGQDLVAMRPDTSFVKAGAAQSTQAMAAPGRAYALYLARGKSDPPEPVALSLDLPFGAYNVEWTDPATGANLGSQRWIHPGGASMLKGPRLNEDLALRLVRSGSEVQAAEMPRGAMATATSPDGRTQISVVLANMAGVPGYEARPRLYYRVQQGDDATNRKLVLPWSAMGIRRSDQDFVNDLRWGSVSSREIRERYRLASGKALDQSAHAQETTVTLRNGQGAALVVDLRAYDDGVAFRYRFPEKQPGWFEVVAEETSFRIPHSSLGYLTPHHDPTEYKPAYENDWLPDVPPGTTSPMAAGWSFPALFHVPAHWVLLTESGLDGGFAGTRLAAEAPGGVYKVRLPDPDEGEAFGRVAPRSKLPWSLPWRVLVVGSHLNTIVESNLVTHLAAPSAVSNTSWIKPGRAAWSWWSDSDSPQDYARMLPFIDMAAAMSWEYFLVDANWDRMKGGDWKQLAAYAKTKGVRLLLWYNSGGPNNVVSERPRDRMTEREARRAEMKMISDAGIAGLKVDFFQSDKQATIQQYLDILQDAADFKLLVNFHGCTLPRGWSRTFPNLMAHEAVQGGEAYKYTEKFPQHAATHNSILPFTRNVVGPMDYTPVMFSNVNYPHLTTYAHELALSVVLESGLLHFADSVKAYTGLPEAPKAFLKMVPVAWDETRFVTGHPGKLAVLARRKGRDWYVGGISGVAEATTVNVSLSFLGINTKQRYEVAFIGDGDSDRTFASRTSSHVATENVAVAVRGNGGFVMKISPAR